MCAWSSKFSSGFSVSADKGDSWRWRGGAIVPDAENRVFEGHTLVECENGRLWCISRTKGSGIGQAFSDDKGENWGPVRPFAVTNASTRTFFTRLKSGDFLLVKNGPIGKNVGRKELPFA